MSSATKPLKKDQVVWAKLKGYPWWPSCVSSVNANDALVNFLGENSHANVKFDLIVDFKEHFATYSKSVNDKNRKLKEAIEIGKRISEGKTTYEEEITAAERKLQKDHEDADVEEEEQATAQQSASEISNSAAQKEGGKKATAVTATSIAAAQTGKVDAKKGKSKGSKAEIEVEVSPSAANKAGQSNAAPETKESPPVSVGDTVVAGSTAGASVSVTVTAQASEKTNKVTKKTAKNNTKQARRAADANEKATPIEAHIDDQAETEPSNSPDNQIHSFEQQVQETVQVTSSTSTGNKKGSKGSSKVISSSSTNGSTEFIGKSIPNNNSNNTAENGQTKPEGNHAGSATTTAAATAASNGRNKRAIAESRKQELHDSPTKKGKVNNNNNSNQLLSAETSKFYANPTNTQELVSSLEAILVTLQRESEATVPVFSSKIVEDISKMSSAFVEMNLSTSDLLGSLIGKHFFAILELIDRIGDAFVVVKASGKTDVAVKEVRFNLENIVESIKNTVIRDTLGEKYLIFLQGRGKHESSIKDIGSPDGMRGSDALGGGNSSSSSEEAKKAADQQMRKKICKRISELLKTDYALEKSAAQDLCVQIERKIKSAFSDLNDYKRYVKGLIRLLKEKLITADKLETINAEELILIIKNHNIQVDLRNIGMPQFDRNAAESD